MLKEVPLKFKEGDTAKLKINNRWRNHKVVEAKSDDWLTFEDKEGVKVVLSPVIHINHIKKPVKRKVKTKVEIVVKSKAKKKPKMKPKAKKKVKVTAKSKVKVTAKKKAKTAKSKVKIKKAKK
tara:strand:- start:7845 stop:8213 length:369 start_codon:yes stop_codon:yes gene_type:complete